MENENIRNWKLEKGIVANTDIYTMPNGLRVLHNKTLNRAHVQSPDNSSQFDSIDTSCMTVTEWDQTLQGIEKL